MTNKLKENASNNNQSRLGTWLIKKIKKCECPNKNLTSHEKNDVGQKKRAQKSWPM